MREAGGDEGGDGDGDGGGDGGGNGDHDGDHDDDHDDDGDAPKRCRLEVDCVIGEVLKGLLLPFFTALGVIVGGSFIGGLAALFYDESPFYRMQTLASDVKLWAIVVVIGGTFPTLRALDSGLFGGEFMHLVRQVALIITGFMGSQAGFWIVMTVTGGKGA